MILVCSGITPPTGDRPGRAAEEKFTIFLSDEAGVKHYQSKTEEVHADRTIGFAATLSFQS